MALALLAISAVTRFTLTRDAAPVRTDALRVTFMPMTSEPGNEIDPALSASGKLAYVARGDDGQAHLFTKATPDAPGVQITRGDATDHAPAWSPDEASLAFVRRDSTGCHIVTSPADGRTVRVVAPCASRDEFKMSWSPDGECLAITAGDGRLSSPSHIEVLTIADGARRAVTQAPAGHAGDLAPAFSPDGRSIAFVRVISGGITSLSVVPSAGGAVVEITRDGSDVLGVDWDPAGTHLIYSSDRAGAISVWRILARRDSRTTPQPELLAGGGSKLKHPSVARAAGTVAYEEWQYEINLRDSPADASGDEAADATVAISPTADRWNFHPQISPDGSQIAFQSTRSGAYEIWLSDRAGRNARPLTRSAIYKSMPRWSPDGRRLAFTSRVEGDLIRSQLTVLDVTSGVERVAAESAGPLGLVAPSWSHDGARIYVGGSESGDQFAIATIDVATGTRRHVIDSAFAAIESPDGAWLYFARLDRPGLWRQPVGGGTTTLIAERVLADQWPNWGVTDRGVYYVGYPDAGDPQLFTIENGATTPRPLTRLPQLAWPGIALSRDGTRVLYAHADRRSANVGGLRYK